MTLKQQIVEILVANRWIQTDREQAAEKADRILALLPTQSADDQLTEARAEAAAAIQKVINMVEYHRRLGIEQQLEPALRVLLTPAHSSALAQVKAQIVAEFAAEVRKVQESYDNKSLNFRLRVSDIDLSGGDSSCEDVKANICKCVADDLLAILDK